MHLKTENPKTVAETMSANFSTEEVTKHDKASDLWIVLHGKVYDVTKFLKEHPGGEEVLLNLAGKDATQCFDDIGHSQEAKQLKDGYEIGLLDGTSTSTSTTKPQQQQQQQATAPTTDDDDWQYQEPKKESSPYFPMFVGLGVLIYAVIFYYMFY